MDHTILKTVSEKVSLAKDSLKKTKIVKDLAKGMMFKLCCDVDNGVNKWNIYVWSSALCQWNHFASHDDIPHVTLFDRWHCCEAGSTTKPNFRAEANFEAMEDFVKNFVDNI